MLSTLWGGEQPTSELDEAQLEKMLQRELRPSCIWVQILVDDLTTYVNVPVRVIYHEIYSHSLVARYYTKKHDQMLLKVSTFLGCLISYDGLDCSGDVERYAYRERNEGKDKKRSQSLGELKKDDLSTSGSGMGLSYCSSSRSNIRDGSRGGSSSTSGSSRRGSHFGRGTRQYQP